MDDDIIDCVVAFSKKYLKHNLWESHKHRNYNDGTIKAALEGFLMSGDIIEQVTYTERTVGSKRNVKKVAVGSDNCPNLLNQIMEDDSHRQ